MKSLKRNFLMLAAAILAVLSFTASPDANAQDTALNMRWQQRNAADNGNVDRFIAPPAPGTNCLFYFNGSTVLPSCAGIGSGLSLTDGVLSSTASGGAAQVNADWTATTGVARILNKPTISTVGMTGQYGDLSGTPSLAPVATTGAYADLSGRPTIPAAQVASDWSATTGVSRILNKPVLASVATSGSYNDLQDKPTIPTMPTRVFAMRTPTIGTCFQLSATRDVQVSYAVDITVTLTLTGGARGSTFLRSYSDSACSVAQQTLASGSSGLPASLSVTVGLQNLGTVTLPAIVPAGAWVRIETSSDAGTPTFAARSGQEVQL